MKRPSFELRPASVLTACTLLAPIVLVQVIRLVFSSSGPASASAGSLQMDPVLSNASVQASSTSLTQPPKLNDKQRAAATWLREMQSSVRIVASPFPAREVKQNVTETPTVHVEVEQPKIEWEIPAELRRLTLTSVLRAASGQYATLSGKVVTVGDEPSAGWIVINIDTEGRTVLLEGPDHRQVLISQDRPLTVPTQGNNQPTLAPSDRISPSTLDAFLGKFDQPGRMPF